MNEYSTIVPKDYLVILENGEYFKEGDSLRTTLKSIGQNKNNKIIKNERLSFFGMLNDPTRIKQLPTKFTPNFLEIYKTNLEFIASRFLLEGSSLDKVNASVKNMMLHMFGQESHLGIFDYVLEKNTDFKNSILEAEGLIQRGFYIKQEGRNYFLYGETGKIRDVTKVSNKLDFIDLKVFIQESTVKELTNLINEKMLDLPTLMDKELKHSERFLHFSKNYKSLSIINQKFSAIPDIFGFTENFDSLKGFFVAENISSPDLNTCILHNGSQYIVASTVKSTINLDKVNEMKLQKPKNTVVPRFIGEENQLFCIFYVVDEITSGLTNLLLIEETKPKVNSNPKKYKSFLADIEGIKTSNPNFNLNNFFINDTTMKVLYYPTETIYGR